MSGDLPSVTEPKLEKKRKKPLIRQPSIKKKAERISEMVRLLQARGWKIDHLAYHFEVSTKTVKRDLESIEKTGIPIEEDYPKIYSISKLSMPLEPVEALAAYTAIRLAYHHSPSLNRHYYKALLIISNNLPKHIQNTLNDSITSKELQEEASREIELVARAWAERTVLYFDYQKPNGDLDRANKLHVYFIEVSRDNLAPYVIGLEAGKRNKIRTFKLARMQNVHILNESYEIDPDFDPKEFLSNAWGVIGAKSPETVTVRFAKEAMYRIIEGGYPSMELVGKIDERTYEIRTGLDNKGFPREIMPFLLSWGPRIEVLSPDYVREAWLGELKEALQRYD